MRYSILCIVSLLCGAPDLGAQRSADLVEGIKVRVEPFRGKAQTGVLAAYSADSITIMGSGAGGRSSLAIGDVREIAISRGDRGMRGFMAGGAKWALIGGLGAAAIDAATFKKQENCWCFGPNNRGESAALTGVLIAIPAFLIGGLRARGSEEWTQVTFR